MLSLITGLNIFSEAGITSICPTVKMSKSKVSQLEIKVDGKLFLLASFIKIFLPLNKFLQ